MNFGEALLVMLNGGKIRRALWPTLAGDVGDWVEIVSGTTPDGRSIKSAPMIWQESGKAFSPWGGAANDVLEEDWEEVQ